MKIALMYHDVYTETPHESGFQNASAFQYKISVSEFEAQVKAISEYCKKNIDTEVEFTFDDGGISFLNVIAPILEKYNQKGIFFITTKFLNTPLFLDDKQLEELHRHGHIIGSHSHSHNEMSKLNDEEINNEWKKSLRILQKFTSNDIYASIPNGDTRNYVELSAEKHKIKKLYTSTPTTKNNCRGNMDLIGRYVVYQGMTSKEVLTIISSFSCRKKMYLKWYVLRIIKLLFGNKYNKIKSKFFRK